MGHKKLGYRHNNAAITKKISLCDTASVMTNALSFSTKKYVVAIGERYNSELDWGRDTLPQSNSGLFYTNMIRVKGNFQP